MEVIPRSEQFVLPALERPIDRQKIGMFCKPDQIYLDYLKYCRILGIKTIYRCVDDWQYNFGEGWYDRAIEKEMITLTDVAVASSRRMAEQYGLEYLPNACAYVRPQSAIPGNPPVVGFAGLADLPRFDLDLVRSLAAHFPGVHFEIIGTQHPWRKRNITALVGRPWREAVLRMKKFDVGIIPYRGDHLQGMQPIKSWEYLGMGIPQLCQQDLDLPDHESVFRYQTLAECIEKLETILSGLTSFDRPSILSYAAQNTWQARIRQLLGWFNLPG